MLVTTCSLIVSGRDALEALEEQLYCGTDHIDREAKYGKKSIAFVLSKVYKGIIYSHTIENNLSLKIY
jgi:hypothetical protein